MSKSCANKRILLTGSAGAVGGCVARALLGAGHAVRGYDLRPSAWLDDDVVADITDAEALGRAMDGRDTLVHLAAFPNPAPFVETLLEPNVVGLYRVMQAAVGAGVSRIVLASTLQVVGGHLRQRGTGGGPISTSARSPRNDYALTKLWAEDLGEMAAARHEGLTVIAARIGWFARTPQEMKNILEHKAQEIYLSHHDAGRFFVAAVEADPNQLPGRFAVFNVVGPGMNAGPVLDLEPGRRWLRYEPCDMYPAGSRWD